MIVNVSCLRDTSAARASMIMQAASTSNRLDMIFMVVTVGVLVENSGICQNRCHEHTAIAVVKSGIAPATTYQSRLTAIGRCVDNGAAAVFPRSANATLTMVQIPLVEHRSSRCAAGD